MVAGTIVNVVVKATVPLASVVVVALSMVPFAYKGHQAAKGYYCCRCPY